MASGKLIYKKNQISGSPAIVDEVKSGNMNAVTSNAVNGALTNQFNATNNVLTIGNLKIEFGIFTETNANFTSGGGAYRYTYTNNINFKANFQSLPKVVASTLNDDDYMYSNVVGIVRDKTRLKNITLQRNQAGSGLVNIAWIAIGV